MSEATVNMFLAIQTAGPDRDVFIHEGARWHFGECFPDMDSCAVPIGADLDEEAH